MRFAPDVRFVAARYAVCEGIRCADVVFQDGHRTVRLARDAFTSPSRLRATLLEVQTRYERPNRGVLRDLALAALTVLRRGAEVGVRERGVLRDAYYEYAGLYAKLAPEARDDLPEPGSLQLP